MCADVKGVAVFADVAAHDVAGFSRRRRLSATSVDMAQPIDTPERAIRLARTIASDISLYNEEKILRGLTEDKLFTELRDEIEEGRELYRTRVAADLYDRTNFFDRAVVDIILKSKGHVKSKIW